MCAAEYSLLDYDEYIARLFAPEDDSLQATRAVMQQEGLRPINISVTAPCVSCGTTKVLN